MTTRCLRADVSDDAAVPNVSRIPPLVDVDAHVVEPPDVWTSRLPEKYREVGPHIEYHPAGPPSSQAAPTSRHPARKVPTSPGGATRTTAIR